MFCVLFREMGRLGALKRAFWRDADFFDAAFSVRKVPEANGSAKGTGLTICGDVEVAAVPAGGTLSAVGCSETAVVRCSIGFSLVANGRIA